MAGARLIREDLSGAGVRGSGWGARGIDATLGIAGLPQSGTGQTALLSGRNAPELLGRHFGPWVPTALRQMLAAESILQTLVASGHAVSFANAYPTGYFKPGGRGFRRPGALPLAAHAAGLLTRDEGSVRAGAALVSSITTDSWRRYVDPDAPLLAPEDAGHRLARIGADSEFTLFAHYDTDHVGHRGTMADAVAVIERVDAFLGGLFAARTPETLVVVTSDHGNIEEIAAGHTLNPVPLLAVGPGCDELIDGAKDLCDLAPLIEAMLWKAPMPE